MMLREIYYIAKTFLLMSKIALLFVPTLWPKLSGIASGHTDNKKGRPQAARFAAAVDKTALSCLVRGSWIRRWLSATPRQTPVGGSGAYGFSIAYSRGTRHGERSTS